MTFHILGAVSFQQPLKKIAFNVLAHLVLHHRSLT